MVKRKEIQYISFLQLIGPVFVIFGHSLNGIESNQGLWWLFTKQWIYIFHMPLFFMISGYLLSYGNWMKGKSYKEFVKNKFYRLIIPYLVWNGVFLVPKYFSQNFLSDEIQMNIGYLLKVFLSPRQNVWGHTWFLAGLFIIYLFTPMWKKIFSKRSIKVSISIIALGIILYMYPIRTEWFCLSDLHKDTLFFCVGCILGSVSVDKLKLFLKKTLVVNCIIAIISSIISLQIVTSKQLWFIPCSFILLTLLTIGIYVDDKMKSTLIKFSRRSFGIYILHWPVMVALRILCLNILDFSLGSTVFLMILGGLIIPNIVLEILSKINIDKINKLTNCLLGV